MSTSEGAAESECPTPGKATTLSKSSGCFNYKKEFDSKEFIGFDNAKNCHRSSSGMAGLCSAHIRQMLHQDVLRDNVAMDFCFRHYQKDPQNVCNLCSIETSSGGWEALSPGAALPNFGECDGYLKSKYPLSGRKVKNDQQLVVTVNSRTWIRTYIKLTSLNSLIRSTAPSGYKGKERMSVGSCMLLQGNSCTDLVMFIKKDPNYDGGEFTNKKPVVNAVGFWGLDQKKEESDETTSPEDDNSARFRYLLQLHENHTKHSVFGFLRKSTPSAQNIRSISVDFYDKNTNHRLNLFSWRSSNSNVVPLANFPILMPPPPVPVPIIGRSRAFQAIPRMNGYKTELRDSLSSHRKMSRAHKLEAIIQSSSSSPSSVIPQISMHAHSMVQSSFANCKHNSNCNCMMASNTRIASLESQLSVAHRRIVNLEVAVDALNGRMLVVDMLTAALKQQPVPQQPQQQQLLLHAPMPIPPSLIQQQQNRNCSNSTVLDRLLLSIESGALSAISNSISSSSPPRAQAYYQNQGQSTNQNLNQSLAYYLLSLQNQ